MEDEEEIKWLQSQIDTLHRQQSKWKLWHNLNFPFFPTAITFDVEDFSTEVDVINLPIDEQGNLKTTIAQSSKIMLVYNESLTVPSDPNNCIYLTSVNTTGYKYAYVMARAQGTWTQGICQEYE